MPSPVRAELYKDPLYLRALSSAYTSVGDDLDAQRVIKVALDLPFPADARGLQAETQLQYAGLLQAANHLDQAAGLYRQVLAKDQNNTDAWQGLVRTEHALGQDDQALQTLESMPPASYAKAMREPGFDATVAGLYEAQKRYDVAQDILEKALAQQVSTGQKPSAPAQLQLAGIYMERNDPQQAYPIYRQLINAYPDRTDAWKGLLSTLHNTGRDSEVLAEIPQIPQATRARLESDPDFLQTMGAVYNQLGQPQQAESFLRRVQQHYAMEHTQTPADVDIQNAWLLYNGGNDAGLHTQLLTLGGRTDLTDAQRRTIQTIWANWAVRRANQAAAAGDTRRALAILNATARAFPDNPGVIKALAAGYARSGDPKRAVMIWKAQDLNSAPASDYKAAIGAALAAGDTKDAETWLRFGLDQYPKDPELLNLGAKFEASTGNVNRAADYYRAQLDAMPPPDPGAELATELSRPVPMSNSNLPSVKSAQDLAALLAPSPNDKPSAAFTQQAPEPPVSEQPYLPSYGSAGAPVQLYTNPAQNGIPPASSTPVVPSYMTAPSSQAPAPASTAPRTHLRDYVPQASLDEPLPLDATRLPDSVMVAYTDFSGPMISPAMYQQQQISRLTQQAESGQQSHSSQNQNVKPLPLTSQPVNPATPQSSTAGPAAQTAPAVDPVTGEIYGPYVPYKPTTIQLGSTPVKHPVAQPEVTDVLPTARYVPNAKVNASGSSHPDINAANAAAIRRRQSEPPPLTGESRPPVEDYKTNTSTEPAQYTGQSGQIAQPNSQPAGQSPYPQQQGSGDSSGQQYPQPGTERAITPFRGRARAHTAQPAAPSAPAPAAQVPARQPVQSGLSYPGVGTPLGSQPYPVIGPSFPLGPAPTDQDLMSQHLPPLRGNYYTGAVLAPQVPLTERQQAERDLATLEASYSGWAGGTASARYRSGTPGLDQLTDLEATVEASATIGNSVRLTIVPRTVFLNSGTIDAATYAGLSGPGVPVLGTLQANAASPPAQQSVSGIGGELQLASRNFAAAVGYTPYEFLVRNVTGRFLFKAGQHFTLYGNRQSVTETELSYAGLRDPGSATITFPGNIWGGVVDTGGGIRFDMGDEKAGFYITADGSDLSGYHVLENSKFEGSAGAYFLAHTFPGYGKINIGASLFGMHFASNERSQTYGLGGYFSPDSYILASVPITFTGRYGDNFHYTVAGSLGVQSFQEDSGLLFPLDRGAESAYETTNACTLAQEANRTCGYLPNNSNTGANYSFNAEGAYRITEHWYGGGYLSANNTNNYNTVTGGFFVRYLFRPQYSHDDYPTGLFPVEGFRPLRVP
jgi:tetratricopeptide (TPR) repeat protein